MKRWIFLLLMIIPFMSNANPQLQISKISPAVLRYYELKQKDMTISDKTYRLFIAVPKQRASGKTLYLLDGNGQFPKGLNAVNLRKPLPLIVGIGYQIDQAYDIAQRTRDYTFVPDEQFAGGGEAKAFLKVIAEQVKPYIRQHYSSHRQQDYLFGHSLGGLFGLYVLFSQPELFQYYVIVSPSLWWGRGAVEKLSRHPQGVSRGATIILGEYEESPEKDPKMTAERLEKIRQRRQLGSARAFAEQLKTEHYSVRFLLIPHTNHGSVIQPALIETMREIQQ